jgi:anhydro-N-acetylmuramic acid kinase
LKRVWRNELSVQGTKVQKFTYSEVQTLYADYKTAQKDSLTDGYRVVGLMSGTSLDGVDLVLATLWPPTSSYSHWRWHLESAVTAPLAPDWHQFFGHVIPNQTPDARTLFQLDVTFGKYLGGLVKNFLAERGMPPVDFVASHGHTLFHEPTTRGLTFQLGHGGALAVAAGLPVVADFRSTDVVLGGQGAPLVPLGDRLLFPEYTVCVNLGGIANLSVEVANGGRLAYDICACNQLFNALAAEIDLPYDEDGRLARSGQLLPELQAALDAPSFFAQAAPKSLGREWVEEHSLAALAAYANSPLPDRLHTAVVHVAGQLSRAIERALAAAPAGANRQVLLTGGGALNGFLVEEVRRTLGSGAQIVVPTLEIVQFKEALVFALLGTLRWRGEINTLASATGAQRDSSGGAIYAP